MDALSELRAMSSDIPARMIPVCLAVLDDPLFHEGIGSASHHPVSHQQPGGLVLHTLEVARAAVKMCPANLVALAYVAALFHDYGKIYEYRWLSHSRTVEKLPFATRVGHVVYGWATFLGAAAEDGGFTEEETAEIAHALLAHMGRKEWGSPVEPQTELAHILHTADLLSAKGLVRCS